MKVIYLVCLVLPFIVGCYIPIYEGKTLYTSSVYEQQNQTRMLRNIQREQWNNNFRREQDQQYRDWQQQHKENIQKFNDSHKKYMNTINNIYGTNY